jgi:ribonuclease P protein component
LSGSYRFRPYDKLRSSTEYQRVKRSGRRARTAHFGVNFVPNDQHHHRLGLVVQKRFWNAVGRNRIKRRLREWFRLNRHLIPAPAKDIVIIARPGAERLALAEMAAEILAVLVKQGGRNS